MERIDSEIQQYISKNIIPEYSGFDEAHKTDHVQNVIANSLSLADEFGVSNDIVYVVAAYHDLGLRYGREDHEKNSAIILSADSKLKQWFTEPELTLMAEAVEDHRASNLTEPRSIYGKIVSDADRDLNYETILIRTIQYSLKHFPNYTMEQHCERTLNQVQEKYAERGYMKLWLNAGKNQQTLQNLHKQLRNREIVRTDTMQLLEQLTMAV